MLFFFYSFSSLKVIVVFVRECTRKLCAPFWICDLFVGHSAGWLDKCVSRTKTKTPVRFPVDGTTKRRGTCSKQPLFPNHIDARCKTRVSQAV